MSQGLSVEGATTKRVFTVTYAEKKKWRNIIVLIGVWG
jgi:hypothetical protein